MRASDAERDLAISRLRDRFAEGRLSQETFLYRVDVALRAKDQADLTGLFDDLPAASPQVALPTRLAGVGRRIAAALRPRRRYRPRPPGPPAPLFLPRDVEHRFTIGRALECDLTLADLSVSRWHARLHHEDSGWLLSDLGSTNGTRLNGWRVTTPVEVRAGDQVSFGGITFVVGDP
jgi:hypothetical protein